jgi:hypothetical protein
MPAREQAVDGLLGQETETLRLKLQPHQVIEVDIHAHGLLFGRFPSLHSCVLHLDASAQAMVAQGTATSFTTSEITWLLLMPSAFAS